MHSETLKFVYNKLTIKNCCAYVDVKQLFSVCHRYAERNWHILPSS